MYFKCYKSVSRIRKYHNHTLQTKSHRIFIVTRHPKVNKSKAKHSDQLSFPRQDASKTRNDRKLRIPKPALRYISVVF